MVQGMWIWGRSGRGCGEIARKREITGVDTLQRGGLGRRNMMGKNSREMQICTPEICRTGGLGSQYGGGGSKYDVKWVPLIKCGVEAGRRNI